MLKRNSWLIATLTGLVVATSLYLSVIVKAKTEFDLKLVFAYLLIGFVLFAYSMVMSKFQIKYGANILLIGTIIASLYLYTGMPVTSEAFIQLAIGLGFFMILFATIAITLVYSIIIVIRRRQTTKVR